MNLFFLSHYSTDDCFFITLLFKYPNPRIIKEIEQVQQSFSFFAISIENYGNEQRGRGGRGFLSFVFSDHVSFLVFDDGSETRLLSLSGEMPVKKSKVPLQIFIPLGYPTSPPIIYARPPLNSRYIINSQNDFIDKSSGLCSPPYLLDWSPISILHQLIIDLKKIFEIIHPFVKLPQTTLISLDEDDDTDGEEDSMIPEPSTDSAFVNSIEKHGYSRSNEASLMANFQSGSVDLNRRNGKHHKEVDTLTLNYSKDLPYYSAIYRSRKEELKQRVFDRLKVLYPSEEGILTSLQTHLEEFKSIFHKTNHQIEQMSSDLQFVNERMTTIEKTNGELTEWIRSANGAVNNVSIDQSVICTDSSRSAKISPLSFLFDHP